MSFLKNRILHLAYRVIYITLVLIGILASWIGWFKDIHNEFYVFFTNQTNIFALIVALLLVCSCIKDIIKKDIYKKEDRFINLEFMNFIYLIITAIFFNVFSPNEHLFTLKFWSRIQVWILHLVSPFLFSLDFILFADKDKITKFAPFEVTLYPLAYSIFVIIRAIILGDVPPFKESGYIRFPYPIFDYVTYGVMNVILMLCAMFILSIGLSYLIKFLVQLPSKKKNQK